MSEEPTPEDTDAIEMSALRERLGRYESLINEKDNRLERIIAIHPLREKPQGWDEQYTFVAYCDTCRGERWPCPTVRALAAPVTETP